MAECVVCGEQVAVSNACPHCAQLTCPAHRTAHDCPGVSSDGATWYTDPDAGRAAPTPTAGVRELSEPRRLAAGVIAVVVIALVAALAVGATAGSTGIDDERVERLVVTEVNDARTARGLAPLAANTTLAGVADAHSADMAARGYVNHTAPDGTTVAERLAQAGLTCPGGENIYYTPNGRLLVTERGLAERVVAEWLRSPGHRRALLDTGYTRQGIGVVVGGDGGIYVTQNLC
ncbi:CAP domain-containing protein [Halosegnis sp.]|uniref:CAP domain-containing protein n=1 Tax=Halosegnis sp. TaxID=2864959 RepID=UPI0035D52320